MEATLQTSPNLRGRARFVGLMAGFSAEEPKGGKHWHQGGKLIYNVGKNSLKTKHPLTSAKATIT